jgi:threonine synthase
MQYFSTNRKSAAVPFREAVLNGQPDDKGLYFPESIPKFPANLLSDLADLSESEIAFTVIKPYVADSIPDEKLFEICQETVDFQFPLVEISDEISALELFHGPTLAFKDVGARFMSRCLQHFCAENSQKTVVIVATSGDTGGAVASGFHDVEGIDVVILYPKGKVSRVQELQLTTLGGNVITLEVQGTFDDCQLLAKQALADADLREKVFLTSANSINVARWLPQQFYYPFALKQWEGLPPVISVPSGNFGNLAAGMLAYKSGLPIKGFIAACNANDVVPEFFRTGSYEPKPSVSTLSNAMDVGDPSNFVRILEMFEGDRTALRQTLESVSISDDRTAETMRLVHEKHGYVLDPHGAVAYAALSDNLKDRPKGRGFILETAHPVKFDSVEKTIGNYVVMPESVKQLGSQTKYSIEIAASYEKVKEVVLSRI